jgi:hypothetical protein
VKSSKTNQKIYNQLMSEILSQGFVAYEIYELLSKLPSFAHPLLFADLDNPIVAVKGNCNFS